MDSAQQNGKITAPAEQTKQYEEIQQSYDKVRNNSCTLVL